MKLILKREKKNKIMDGWYGDPNSETRYLITGPVQILDDGKTEIYCLLKDSDHTKIFLVYNDEKEKAFLGHGFNIPFSWLIH